MASPPAGSSSGGSVHVPCCGNLSCQPFLRRTVEALQQGGVRCVVDYEPGGLYQQRFQQAFDQTTCTILHVCPKILQQAQRVESVLRAHAEKTWFVQLESPASSDASPELLLDFHIKDLSTQDKRTTFIDDLLIRFGPSQTVGQDHGGPQSPETQQPPSATQGSEGQGEAEFHCLPMVLRAGAAPLPSVNRGFFSLDPAQCSVQGLAINSEMLAQNDIPVKDIAYIAHVILPDLHQRGDLISLAHFARSPHLQFQFEALHLLCGLLLERRSDFSREALLETERILFKSLESHQKDSVETHQQKDYAGEHLSCCEFLATVYLLLVSACMLGSGEAQENDAWCQRILQRSLFDKKKTSSLTKALKKHVSVTPPSPSIPPWLGAVKLCLRAWSTGCGRMRKKVVTALRHPSPPQPSRKADSPSWSLPMKFCLLVECLSESFRASRPVFLDFQKSFQLPKAGVKASSMTLQRLSASLLIWGVTSFLQKRSETLSSCEDFQSLCGQTVESVGVMAAGMDKASRGVCSFNLTPLLFSMNKTVRQRTGFLLRQHFFYHEHLWDLLLLETILLFWPMLSASEVRLGATASSHQSWVVVPSTFNGQPVQTHVHRPTTTEHLNHNRTDDRSLVQQDQHFRELGLLKELKQENVLSLVAFHEERCPQVYITEDYLTAPLQSTLVNRSRSGLHFSLRRLMSIMVEALQGIQYCHEKRIVHRDLTAANFFLTDDGRVKLAGFKHALKMSGKSDIRDFDLSFVARRWSAPESHRHCCFSRASDMWMVGHLLYEVLTHGRLPYADIQRSDEELMPMVVAGKKRLCHEQCIPKSMEDVIMRLTRVRDSERNMSAQNVASKLQCILRSSDFPESLSRFFPNLQSDDQAATKHAKGPILTLIDDFPGIELPLEQHMGEEGEESQHGQPRRPKRGCKHFVKPCPESFTSVEWDVLKQEDLPSITKLISRPCHNDSGQRVLPFMVAASSTLYSLEEAVKGRCLGPDLFPYVQCLQQLAANMAYLHSRRIILCDFCPQTIHVEQFSNNDMPGKVWITSLPQIKMLPEGSELERHVDLHAPQDGEQRRRAAPEVLQHGHYSPASDVYCFAWLLWWVFNAFDLTARGAVDHPGDFSPLDDVPLQQVYENIVSFQCPPMVESCPAHLCRLMQDCWDPNRHLRPRMTSLQRKLTLEASQIPAAHEEEDGYEPIFVANASDTTSVSDQRSTISSTVSVEFGNPSELSDSDLEDEEVYLELPSEIECYDDLEDAVSTSSVEGDRHALAPVMTATYRNLQAEDGTGVSHLSAPPFYEGLTTYAKVCQQKKDVEKRGKPLGAELKGRADSSTCELLPMSRHTRSFDRDETPPPLPARNYRRSLTAGMHADLVLYASPSHWGVGRSLSPGGHEGHREGKRTPDSSSLPADRQDTVSVTHTGPYPSPSHQPNPLPVELRAASLPSLSTGDGQMQTYQTPPLLADLPPLQPPRGQDASSLMPAPPGEVAPAAPQTAGATEVCGCGDRVGATEVCGPRDPVGTTQVCGPGDIVGTTQVCGPGNRMAPLLPATLSAADNRTGDGPPALLQPGKVYGRFLPPPAMVPPPVSPADRNGSEPEGTMEEHSTDPHDDREVFV